MNKKGKYDALRNKAIELLKIEPKPMQYGDLKRSIMKSTGESDNSVDAALWNLHILHPKDVFKPSRGIIAYRFSSSDSNTILTNPGAAAIEDEIGKSVNENDFYKPFAGWLKDMNECTRAEPLGGKLFGSKWGTPDVIGVWETNRRDIIKGIIEIVSAEIKTDANQIVTAFGQACAYRLFSHKVYLVIPKNSTKDDLARTDKLCQLFGIGLVLMNTENPSQPEFEIRARPQKFEPDLYEANEHLAKVEKLLWK